MLLRHAVIRANLLGNDKGGNALWAANSGEAMGLEGREGRDFFVGGWEG